MKKRAMEKWIPKGHYCYDYANKKKSFCKWRKYIRTIKMDKSNCAFAQKCDEVCWSNPGNSCKSIVYRCDYLNYTDWNQESLLWDSCKECGVKDF